MTEPVLFLPDMMCDARVFGPQIADLSRDYAVMTAPVTHGERVEEIASGLLDVAPMRFALAGLGMGGMVAMELYRRAPERVTRLALMDTSPLAEPPQLAAQRDPLVIRARSGRLRDVVERDLVPQYLVPGPHHDEIAALVVDMALGLGTEVFARQTRALQRRRDQQSTLRRINVPTVVLCGAEDVICPIKRHSFMAEMIPKAHLCIIEEAGHLPTLEQPADVIRALRDWLSKPLLLR